MHFILYKPFGYVSQFISDNKKKKVLGELYSFPAGTMAIGRLDEESEGLLLLTTEGRMSEQVRSKSVGKEYYVQVDGVITDDAIHQLQTGVEIGIEGVKYVTTPCIVSKIDPPHFPERARKVRDDRHGPTTWISIILTEGKNRQIRKMTAAVGFPTLRLVRIRIGNIMLSGMSLGEVKEVEQFDL